MIAPYITNYHTRDPRCRSLSWREFGQERNDMCDHLVCEIIGPAGEIMARARRDIRRAWSGTTGADQQGALTAAYNALCDAERKLRDQSEESEDESEDDLHVATGRARPGTEEGGRAERRKERFTSVSQLA